MTFDVKHSGRTITRRSAIGLVGTAASCLSSQLLARGAKKSARSEGRRSIIDGNLVAPIDAQTPLDDDTIAQVRSSGLTAIKTTLGGSGNQDKRETDAEIAELDRGIGLNPTVYLKVKSAADFERAKREKLIGVIFSFEAGEMLEGEVGNIDHFRSAGVLVMGLSYNVNTPFASGTLTRQTTGLTDLGRKAVARMNALGVTVDVSHSDELSSMQALDASAQPIIISHAGCAAINPHPRNKSDMLLRSLADRGGVLGIYELSFLVPAPGQPRTDDYLAHIDHALKVCGEDHVGIGTDSSLTPFPTSPENMAAWNGEVARRKTAGVGAPGEGPPPFVIGLNRADRWSVIGESLRRRGHPARVVDKILGANLERVFRTSWRGA